MTLDEAINLHGADAVYTAASAGACEDYEPLRTLGMHVDSIEAADHIGTVVYKNMSAEEKAALHWEASQDTHKNKEPVNWDDIDFQIASLNRHFHQSIYAPSEKVRGFCKKNQCAVVVRILGRK